MWFSAPSCRGKELREQDLGGDTERDELVQLIKKSVRDDLRGQQLPDR